MGRVHNSALIIPCDNFLVSSVLLTPMFKIAHPDRERRRLAGKALKSTPLSFFIHAGGTPNAA
jgi:hypothetical protein